MTGNDPVSLARASSVELADSALHAPAAEFGEQEFCPDLFDKAAVLVYRLARNHLLPDGDKRAAWASLRMFIDLNGGRWHPDPPVVDEAESAMVAAASGEWDEAAVAAWLRRRVRFA